MHEIALFGEVLIDVLLYVSDLSSSIRRLFCPTASKSFCSDLCRGVSFLCKVFCSSFFEISLFPLSIFLFFAELALSSCTFSSGHKNINNSLLTGSAEIFATAQLAEKLELSSLDTKRFMSWIVRGEEAPS